MESHNKRIRFHCPKAVCIFLHIILLSTTIHLNLTCLRSIKTEIGTMFGIQTRIFTPRDIGWSYLCYISHILYHHIFPVKFPPIKIKQFTSFSSLKYEINIMYTFHRSFHSSLHILPTFPTTGMGDRYFRHQSSTDTISSNFYPSATKSTGN